MTLRDENLIAFKGGLDAQLSLYKDKTPKAELVELADGDYNINRDGQLLFQNGARAAAKKTFEATVRGPVRILFGKPATIFGNLESHVLDNETLNTEHNFLTQKYDDINKDIHINDFQREVAESIEELDLKITEKVMREEPYFLVSYGLGLGFHLSELWDRYKPRNLIILESDLDLLYLSLDVFDWKTLIEKIRHEEAVLTLIVDKDARSMLQRLNAAVQTDCIIGLDGLMSVKVSNDPTINLVYSEFQSAKTGNLASYMGYTVDEFNMMKNSFRNMRTGTRRLLNEVRQTPKLPALIVGSGPSLEQNLDFLKSIREKVILISSGSSLRVLLSNGLYPDFQAVLERAKGNYDRHVELSKEYDLKRITAILTTTIWPGTADFFKDAVFFLRPALSPLGVFCHKESEVLSGEGPQVTNTAFAFAARLGFKEIYLLGVDLGARNPDKGRAEAAWITPGLKQRELTIPVRGNAGRTVFTDIALIQQRITIENQIQKLNKKGSRVFNLGDGVLIAGAIPCSPSKVKLKSSHLDREKHVVDLTQQFPIMTRERFVSDWESSKVRESVAKMITQLCECITTANTWNGKITRRIEALNQYVGKPIKAQYAPRLLRGSILRMAMYLQALFIRTSKEKESEILNAITPVWIKMMKRLEREAYELADELESEDPYFSGDNPENLDLKVEETLSEQLQIEATDSKIEQLISNNIKI